MLADLISLSGKKNTSQNNFSDYFTLKSMFHPQNKLSLTRYESVNLNIKFINIYLLLSLVLYKMHLKLNIFQEKSFHSEKV